jgi:SAM-dependent methyltransferase
LSAQTKQNLIVQTDTLYLQEYTAPEAIVKYSKASAGFGINYLLEHDYRAVYLAALRLLPSETLAKGIRMLEFGCGAGMNLLHLLSVFPGEGIHVTAAVGSDFSPVLIAEAKREAKKCFGNGTRSRLDFLVARNESLVTELASLPNGQPGSFHFIFGVNTIRYCHDAGRELECARNLHALLVPGGICVAIDMNNRFPLFWSDLKNRFRRHKERECYVPSLEEYASPFVKTGFELVRQEHFCWVPHSAGPVMGGILAALSPVLNSFARSRAMRSLVVARKPR